MDKFTKLDGNAIPLRLMDVDTDMIIPKQFLKTIKRTGLGQYLFYELKFDQDENLISSFALNQDQYKGASILIAGKNFGCGSSREHAPWSIADYGIKCIIAPSYADIFYNNCFKNGLLPVVLTEQQVSELFDQLYREQGYQLTVDLTEQTVVTAGGRSYGFEIDEFRKQCLLQGLDEIGLTLKQAPAIKRYEEQRAALHPWVFGAIK